jgi:integrase
VAKLADAIEPRLRALVLCNAWCGLRFGEASELRRKDVGTNAATITVARGVTHRDGCHIGTPKSGNQRTVVVPPHIRADVCHHLDTFVAKDPEALLFAPPRGGCHLAAGAFRVRFNVALATIGRRGVRVHDLRHFAGTQTARVGTLAESMSRLGHSTVTASLMYQGLVNGRDVEVAEALSALAQTDMP